MAIQFGGPELLQLVDLPEPVLGPDVVLVRARAAGVNPVDFKIRKGGLESRYPCHFPPARPTMGTCGTLGAEPVAYADGPADRVRFVAPEGITAVLDLVGGEALEAWQTLLRDGGRLASVTDPVRVRELGGRYWFVRPDRDDLDHLGSLVDEGRLAVHVEDTFPLEQAAGAHRRLVGHYAGQAGAWRSAESPRAHYDRRTGLRRS